MNKYSIAVFNHLKHQTYSFNISKFTLILIIMFFISTAMFSIIKLFQFYNTSYYVQKDNVLNPKVNSLISYLIDNQIIDENLISNFDLLNQHNEYTALAPISMPVEGFVSNGINELNAHNGIDIACSFNAKIKATQKGIIVFSGFIEELGNTIIIAHPNQYFSLYAHLNKSLVMMRSSVDKNQIIGLAGQSGNSKGPHLHFEIWQNDNIIDPRNLIKEYRIKDVSIR